MELTDTCRPSDGNRATRKAIDGPPGRRFEPAKTDKLADLIENCRDVCCHDPISPGFT
jgi:hypothetical protein